MKLIKTAIIFKAEIPKDIAALNENLQKKRFSECMPTQLRSIGFVPTLVGGALIEEFPGGLAYTVRIDDKIIPGSVVKAEVKKRTQELELRFDKKVSKKEKAEIKEQVMLELAKRALTKTTAEVTCFYEFESGYLILPTSSEKIADICTSMLTEAVEGVKLDFVTSVNITLALTKRLASWLDNGEGFGDFEPCTEVTLANESRKISVKMSSLQQAHKGLTEGLDAGFSVQSIGFQLDGTTFKLNPKFHLKAIAFEKPEEEDEEEEDNYWPAEAALCVQAVSAIVTQLAEMLADLADPEES